MPILGRDHTRRKRDIEYANTVDLTTNRVPFVNYRSAKGGWASHSWPAPEFSRRLHVAEVEIEQTEVTFLAVTVEHHLRRSRERMMRSFT